MDNSWTPMDTVHITPGQPMDTHMDTHGHAPHGHQRGGLHTPLMAGATQPTPHRFAPLEPHRRGGHPVRSRIRYASFLVFSQPTRSCSDATA
jgi:hypothetical protein